MRINDEGEKTIIYLKRNKNKEKEFVLMSQEKNEFTIIAITGNLTLQEIQGIINKGNSTHPHPKAFSPAC